LKGFAAICAQNIDWPSFDPGHIALIRPARRQATRQTLSTACWMLGGALVVGDDGIEPPTSSV
jgi:hypothetical protein